MNLSSRELNHSNHDIKDPPGPGRPTKGRKSGKGGNKQEKLVIKTRDPLAKGTGCTASGVTVSSQDSLLIKKLSPDFGNSIYDSLRPSVSAILAVSTKFQLKSSRSKGVVLSCGSNDDEEAKEAGFGFSFLPLKTTAPYVHGLYMDNPMITVLAQYAGQGEGSEEKDLPELILGLCCNNWGMYYGRNAMIEAILEVMGPQHSSKLSIHSAVYALEFNTRALSQIFLDSPQGQQGVDSEKIDRELHAAAYQASALKYNLGFDVIEKDNERFQGVTKSDFVQELSIAVAQAVERTMANNGKSVTGLVMEVMRHRRLIQENLSNKRFRRAPSQNGIATACQLLANLFAENFGDASMPLAESTPGWKAFTNSMGGAGPALLGLFCHALDVMAGCVARSSEATVSPHMAERLILTVLDKENRLMEYCFNQVYELMPSPTKPRMYLYRRLDDVSTFATIPCGAVEMGANL